MYLAYGCNVAIVAFEQDAQESGYRALFLLPRRRRTRRFLEVLLASMGLGNSRRRVRLEFDTYLYNTESER